MLQFNIKTANVKIISFSPLFIGARNVTVLINASGVGQELSVPFSSGQGMLQPAAKPKPAAETTFSPLFIGARNVTQRGDFFYRLNLTFSPLFIGARNVTIIHSPFIRADLLSVPFSSGQGMLLT